MTVEKPLYIFEIHSFILIFILTNKQALLIGNSKLLRWANDDLKLYKTAITHMICQSFEEDHIKVSLSIS